MKALFTFFRKRPWLLFVLMFLLLITAWTILIVIAVRNRPETIEVETVGVVPAVSAERPC